MGEIRKCVDFADEYGSGEKPGRWYEFCRQFWGGIHAYMNEQIQCLGSGVRQDVLDKLNLGCELFRDEVGTHLNSLRGVQGQLDLGGGFT